MAAFSSYGYSDSTVPTVWTTTAAGTYIIDCDYGAPYVKYQDKAAYKPAGPMQGEAVRWLEGRVNEMRAVLH